MKSTPVSPSARVLGGLEHVHGESLRLEFVPNGVDVAERIYSGEVAAPGNPVELDPRVGVGGDRQIALGVLDQGDRPVDDGRGHRVVLLATDDGQCLRPGHDVRKRRPVQSQLCLQGQDPFHDVFEVFVGVTEEQEHVAARGDARWHQVPAFHGLGQADHLRGVGQDEAVEPEFVAEQVLQQPG